MKRLFYLAFLVVLLSTATADEWYIETVDSEADVGEGASLAIDDSGHPHISYYDATYRNIKYAYWNGAIWIINRVTTEREAKGHTSLALDSRGNPHISYNTYTELKYATWNGSSWEIETVDSNHRGYYISIALDSFDNPHISYYDHVQEDLMYAVRSGWDWEIETVDSDGYVGLYASLALDSSDNPHISYHDYNNGYLKYAYWNGSSWEIETVDSLYDMGSCGMFTSLVLDPSDNPRISYYNNYWPTHGNTLYCVIWNGSGWHRDKVQFVGYGYGGELEASSLALASNGYLHISYSYIQGSTLYYAYGFQHWTSEIVDQHAYLGSCRSLALDSSNNPHITYYDASNKDLKYATTAPGWDIDNVEIAADAEDDEVMISWTPTGDTPSSIRVLRGEENPVAVSGSLPGETRRWLDRGVEPGGSYVYWLETTDNAGQVQRFGPTAAVVVPEQAQRLALDEPYPNPASGSVSVAFTLPEAQHVSLSVYDLAGRRVAVLSEGELPAGRHTVNWNCAAASAGVYLLRLETQGAALSRRVVVGRIVDR